MVFQHTHYMGAKFHGSLQELKDRVLLLGLDGDWEEHPNSIYKFKNKDKAGMLWSMTKGTIWFDGPQAQKSNLATKIEGALSEGAATAQAKDSTIFVVHGRDHDSRDQLDLILRKLGLLPFILQVTGGGGDTLIEALERMIGKTGY